MPLILTRRVTEMWMYSSVMWSLQILFPDTHHITTPTYMGVKETSPVFAVCDCSKYRTWKHSYTFQSLVRLRWERSEIRDWYSNSVKHLDLIVLNNVFSHIPGFVTELKLLNVMLGPRTTIDRQNKGEGYISAVYFTRIHSTATS